MTISGYPHTYLRSAHPVCIILCMDGVPVWTLGDRLRKAREDADIDIQDMAKRLGYHRNTITAYEADDRPPKAGLIRAWADICAVSLEWLENGTIELHEPVLRPSTWTALFRPDDLRLFDPDGLPDVIDLRDHIVAQMGEEGSLDLYANAS